MAVCHCPDQPRRRLVIDPLTVFAARPCLQAPHKMRTGIAQDHSGFALKTEIQRALDMLRHDVVDFVAHGVKLSDEYPAS